MQRQVETSVRSKILNLIQAWAHAFRNEPKYKVVQDTYQIMKVEGKDAGGKGGRTVAKQICFGGALQKEWALGLSLALVESGLKIFHMQEKHFTMERCLFSHRSRVSRVQGKRCHVCCRKGELPCWGGSWYCRADLAVVA